MQEEQKLSEFNEAAAQMQRLHNIWLSCAISKEQGNINKYETLLRNTETELKYDAKEILKKEDYISQLKKINKDIIKSNQLIFKVQNSIYLQAAINQKWNILITKEELLREIEEEAGKGSKRSDPYGNEGM